MKIYNIKVRVFLPCSECGIGGHYEYKLLTTSYGKVYEFSEYEAQKYIETYSKGNNNIIKTLIKE